MRANGFYKMEDEMFAFECNTFIELDEHKLEIVIKKIARHYGFKFTGLRKSRRMKCYACTYHDYTIRFSTRYQLRLLTLIHECAHLMYKKRYGYHCSFLHDKRLLSCVKKIVKYVKRNKSIQELLGVKYAKVSTNM